mmetsp:Transcript_11172/g.25014  ORF Transcript_11172/g.25014 Transcript_11172/m.25014 type:complete len:245 (+) Transcript_11172:202-936(+)
MLQMLLLVLQVLLENVTKVRVKLESSLLQLFHLHLEGAGDDCRNISHQCRRSLGGHRFQLSPIDDGVLSLHPCLKARLELLQISALKVALLQVAPLLTLSALQLPGYGLELRPQLPSMSLQPLDLNVLGGQLIVHLSQIRLHGIMRILELLLQTASLVRQRAAAFATCLGSISSSQGTSSDNNLLNGPSLRLGNLLLTLSGLLQVVPHLAVCVEDLERNSDQVFILATDVLAVRLGLTPQQIPQ